MNYQEPNHNTPEDKNEKYWEKIALELQSISDILTGKKKSNEDDFFLEVGK